MIDLSFRRPSQCGMAHDEHEAKLDNRRHADDNHKMTRPSRAPVELVRLG
ncbi:MAG: hypothetical protein JO039_01660 [Solirubrobacterales bacterium]|nr:hypothetical protein [Solirubrobacterales bacterium]